MVHVLVRHKVEDFGKWKPIYDGHQEARAAAGLQELHLWHNIDDPNDIFLLFEVADVEEAKAFARSSDLKERMRDAGVMGAPDIFFLSSR
jgi:hypothetical protein